MTETEIESAGVKPDEVVAPPPNPFAEYNTEFRIIEEQWSIAEALKKRKPGFRDRPCIVHDGPINRKKFFKLDSENRALNYVATLDGPLPVKVSAILEQADHWVGFYLLLLNEEALAREPKQRKFEIEKVINQTIIALAKAAPENPTLRSHLTNIFGEAPPLEARTYQALKDWAEFEFPSPRLYGAGAIYAFMTKPNSPAPVNFVTPPPTGDGVMVNLIRNQEAVGRARFTIRQQLHGQFRVGAGLISPMIAAGRSVGYISDRLVSNAAQNTVYGDVENVGEYEYHTQYFEDTQNAIIAAADIDDLQNEIKNYIRRNYGTQEAESIINR